MQLGKKYIVQLCEVSEDTLNKTKIEKGEMFNTNNGIFRNDGIFLNHESILVSTTGVEGLVRECITGKIIPTVTLEITENLDKGVPNFMAPYACYENINFKSRLFAFQIIYDRMKTIAENNPYNRVSVGNNKKIIADFVHSKNMTLSEYRDYLNNRLALLEEKETISLGQTLKKFMHLYHKKKNCNEIK